MVIWTNWARNESPWLEARRRREMRVGAEADVHRRGVARWHSRVGGAGERHTQGAGWDRVGWARGLREYRDSGTPFATAPSHKNQQGPGRRLQATFCKRIARIRSCKVWRRPPPSQTPGITTAWCRGCRAGERWVAGSAPRPEAASARRRTSHARVEECHRIDSPMRCIAYAGLQVAVPLVMR